MSETLFKVILGGALVAGGAYLTREQRRARASMPSYERASSSPRERSRPYRAPCINSQRSWCDWTELPSAEDVLAAERQVYCPTGMHWKVLYDFGNGRSVSVVCHGDASFVGDMLGHKNVFELMLDTGRILTATGAEDLARKLTQYGHSMLDVEYDERAQEAMDLLRADDDTES